MTDQYLLRVKSLTVHFPGDDGPVKAVDGIDFAISHGATIGIVGESGSGKSVTALSIMRLLSTSSLAQLSGSLLWKGEENGVVDLMDIPERQLQKIRGNEISMIFQEPVSALNPSMRCGRQVEEVVKFHLPDQADNKQFILDWFEKVRLPDVERIYQAYPHQLSGGQLQRVMIVMAMITSPRLLIADEPTTALDVTVQQSILTLIKELKEQQNISVIFISHDLGVIGEMADEVIVMQNGKIVEQGVLEQIYTQPTHPYTKGLLACRPPLDKRYYRLPVIEDFIRSEKEEKIFEPEIYMDTAIEKRLDQLVEQPPVLKISGLNTWYPGKRSFFGAPQSFVKAVNGLSFQVYPGETLGIVGESGSGKTTLGRTIIGLERARSGSIRYQGEELVGLSNKAWLPWRKKLQMIFQSSDTSLNPSLTIGAMIMEPMRIHGIGQSRGERKQQAIALLEKVGLGESFFYRYPHECSGGQRQRVAIARTIAVEPELIICDESVSALDVSVQAQILNLLVDLRDQYGLTYLFISHDLSVVRFISDRIMVMNKGVIEEIGTTADVFGNPKKEYTRQLLAAIPKGDF